MRGVPGGVLTWWSALPIQCRCERELEVVDVQAQDEVGVCQRLVLGAGEVEGVTAGEVEGVAAVQDSRRQAFSQGYQGGDRLGGRSEIAHHDDGPLGVHQEVRSSFQGRGVCMDAAGRGELGYVGDGQRLVEPQLLERSIEADVGRPLGFHVDELIGPQQGVDDGGTLPG